MILLICRVCRDCQRSAGSEVAFSMIRLGAVYKPHYDKLKSVNRRRFEERKLQLVDVVYFIYCDFVLSYIIF